MSAEFTLECFRKYYGESLGWIAVLAAGIVLLVFGKRLGARYGKLLVIYSGVVLGLYFFPPTARVMEWCIGEIVYWRVLWLVPAGAVLAYAVGLICEKVKIVWKVNILGLACLVIVAGGGFMYGRGQGLYRAAENPYKIPQDVVEACEIILDAAEGETPLAAGDYDFACYARVYTAEIQMPYGRVVESGTKESARNLRDEFFMGRGADLADVCAYAEDLELDFLVGARAWDSEIFQERGWRNVGETDVYRVWQVPKKS